MLLLVACSSSDPGGMGTDFTTGDSGTPASGGTASLGTNHPGMGSGGGSNVQSGGQSSVMEPSFPLQTGGLGAGANQGSGGFPVGSGGMREQTPDDSASGGSSPSGGGGNTSGDGCPNEGTVSYQLNNSESWPSDVKALIVEAMDEAVGYYNCYSGLSKQITVNYNEGVPTAEANVDGWLTFGSNKAYMQVATAMHEVAHTLGVGYYPWTELMDDGRWVGPNVGAFMSSLTADERDPDEYSQRTYITGDSQHFWPYGLNQASEYQSEWSLINHVRIVAAINHDKKIFLGEEQ